MSDKTTCFWTQDTRQHDLGVGVAPSPLELGPAESLDTLNLHFRASQGITALPGHGGLLY